MSNVSTRHAVTKHISGESKAFSGQRLVRIIAKKDATGKYASANLTETKSVSIPQLAPLDNAAIVSLMPQIMDMVAGFQDSIITDLVKDGRSDITDDDISLPAIITYLATNAGSSRVTKETLQQWFMDAYADIALEYIATALKWDIDNLSPEQEKTLEDKINILRDLFAGFSGGKYSPEDVKCKAMLKFIAFTGDNACARLNGFQTRIETIMAKREEELSSNALGF